MKGAKIELYNITYIENKHFTIALKGIDAKANLPLIQCKKIKTIFAGPFPAFLKPRVRNFTPNL